MTKKLNKRGFTIVELVVVIVVIAILAAVLIPTVSSLVSKANKSKDTQLVKNLNTALAADVNKHNTMSEALAAAAEFGYDVAKINAAEKKNEILWDSVNDVFCYLDDSNVTYIPDSVTTKPSDVSLWKIVADSSSLSSTYSNYLADGFTGDVDATTGIDVGNNSGLNITYNTDATDTVVMRTNGGTLTINAQNATVEHYGNASVVDVQAVAGNSYHEFGKVVELKATSGRIVIESTGLVNKISEAKADAKFEKKSGGLVLEAAESLESTTVSSVVASAEDKANYALEISTAAELAAFRDSVNSGMTYAGLTVKLTADIDLSVYANWNPIGNRYTLSNGAIVDYDSNDTAVRRIFKGTFDGQGHTISNMYINSLTENYQGLRSKLGDATTSSYAALFGYISDATLQNFTVSGDVFGVDVAGVVGITGGTCTIDNVTSNVNLLGKEGTNETAAVRAKVAGFVSCPKGESLTIKNCTNNGSINVMNQKDKDQPIGGFVAYLGVGNLVLDNCVNNGAISASNGTAGGFVGLIQHSKAATVKITNCKNNGDVTGTKESRYAAAIVGRVAPTSTTSTDTITVTINDCSNSGKITTNTDWTAIDEFVGTINYGTNGLQVNYNGTVYSK